MKVGLLLLLFILIIYTDCQLPASKWHIDTNGTTIWEEYGLKLKQGACSWALQQGAHNIEVSLFEDSSYNTYLQMTIYLNYSVNKDYPSYDGIAHAKYQLHEKDVYHAQVKGFHIMPYVQLFNNTLTITQNNATLIVQMAEEGVSEWIASISLIHLVAKLVLLSVMIHFYRMANTKLSLAFVYVLIGWELQAHLTVIKLFQAGKDQSMFAFGVFIGLIGWGVTLGSLLMLPRQLIGWQACEGLFYYGYTCSSGFLFSQAGNIMLYALSPLLQMRFNAMRNIKNSICPYAFSLYLINIFFIYYFKGCPACVLRYPLDLELCIKATIVAIAIGVLLWCQNRVGPLLCARQMIQGKDYKYLEQINLSEGEEMLDETCAICLQSLVTQELVESIRQHNGTRKGKIMRTPCGHRYHAGCLRTWLQQKNTCPLDNQMIPPCFQ